MSALAALAAARRAADETAYDAREMEAREIRRLHATGMTAYRIAQETGLTQRAIAKIVGGQVRKRRATAAECDALAAVLATVGITNVPWMRVPAVKDMTGNPVVGRPRFRMTWESPVPMGQLPGWDEAEGVRWSLDPGAPDRIITDIYACDPAAHTHEADPFGAWLRSEVLRGPEGYIPVRAVLPALWGK
jgi:hypothetical protein